MAGIILNQLHESPSAKQREAAELLGCIGTAGEAWNGEVEGCSSGLEVGGYERWPDELHRAFDSCFVLTTRLIGTVTRRTVRLFLGSQDAVYFLDSEGVAHRVVSMDKQGNLELE